MRTAARGVGTLVLTALCVVYVLWKIDVRTAADVLGHASPWYFLVAAAISIAAVIPMTYRWRRLLAAAGVIDGLPWLVRTYYTSYAFAQVLPTSLGGDASRIFSTVRRHRGAASVVTGSVLLERALGGFATLTLAAVGFALAVGRYDVGAYAWIEGAMFIASAATGVLLLSRRARRPLARVVPLLRAARLERPIRSAYEGLHAYRSHGSAVVQAFAITLAVQVLRVFGIWLVAKAVGVHLSPRPFFVLGPLLFLVMLVPFTINGIALREAFFVSFLGKLHVPPDPAFATGFLFFLLSIATAVPGGLILLADAIPSHRKDMASEMRT